MCVIHVDVYVVQHAFRLHCNQTDVKMCKILNTQVRIHPLRNIDNYHTFFFAVQACKVEDLGKVDFEDEIKKRFKMVYVPNWFSVDLKTGVSQQLIFVQFEIMESF